MSKIIGKVLATEKNPSTMEEFYFWTRPELILNPFDVVKVEHINSSLTFGVIEEISHITDTANFLADYISNDFGDVSTNPITHRIGMNYVKARIVGNSKNIYIPVLNGCNVHTANKDEVSAALGLLNVKNPVPCGYIEMYQGAEESERVKLAVNMDSRYLIGPEGAHLNISGISGLAAKTSYAMFLMKAIQDKFMNSMSEEDDDVAFVIFNVKGKDLLAIDEPNIFDSEDEKNQVISIYNELGMSATPFKNVHYYYPYSEKNEWNTYLEKNQVNLNIQNGKAHMFKYEYEHDKDNLDLMFASLDDPTQTMDAILSYIISGRAGFGKLKSWKEFLDEVHSFGEAGNSDRDKEITVQSWRKFERIVKKSIYRNSIFSNIKDDTRETRIENSLKRIRKNEVHVIDIAKLNDDMQCFVFGDAVRTISNLQLGQYEEEDGYTPPSRIVIFIDELNKYASSDTPKNSPILRQVLEVAERGRSLGIVLFGAEQFKSAIHQRVTGNCSTFAYGRTNAIEIGKSDYRYIPSVYKSMMSRLEQGEYIVQNPIFRSLLNIKFPKPIYKQFK